MQEREEMWIQSLGREEPLEEGMATRSSTLVWRILETESYGQRRLVGYRPQGCKESGHD